VWNQLGRPYLPIRGDVISDIDAQVDWVRIVEDADSDMPENASHAGETAAKLCSLTVFGACNLSMMMPYLRRRFSLHEEFNYPYHDWAIFPLPRIIASAGEAMRAENQAILERLPGMPPSRYQSALIDGRSDAYVLSFSSESFCGYYRARSTGLIVPMVSDRLGPRDFNGMTFEQVLASGFTSITPEQWNFMLTEFEFLGTFDPDRFAEDARRTFEIVLAHGRPVVLVALNDKVGRAKHILQLFAQVNTIANRLARTMEIPVIEMDSYVRTEDDLAQDGQFVGAHFQRQVYARIADEVLALLRDRA